MDFTRKITGSTQERGDRMSYPNIERLGPESSKKKIPSYPDYEIDQDGNVFKNDKMIAFYFTENGYKQIPLRNNKIRKHVYVHGLVAETFIGPKPKGKQTAHIDGNKLNCFFGNLTYVTCRENILHKHAHGTMPKGESHQATKITEKDVLDIRREYVRSAWTVSNTNQLALRYGVHPTTIINIVNRKTWSHVEEIL